MIILSCGAGVQTTALTLMSCENAVARANGKEMPYPLVPIYDYVIFCDLGGEPEWVYKQVDFLAEACEKTGLQFIVLPTDLKGAYERSFGRARVASIPFWSLGEDGSEGKMRRACTIEYKIVAIQKFIRREFLGYRYGEHLRAEDRSAHEMHIGFSAEEQDRIFDSKNPMFVNKFPLAEMGLERPDNYKYCLEQWGLETKASACNFCPFHRNYFFKDMQENRPEEYAETVAFDNMLETRQPDTKIRNKLFISRSRKRIADLTDEECEDAETFEYNGQLIWNGF